MVEKILQQKVMQFCKNADILVFKIDSTSTRGIPDLLLVLPTGTILFVELKTKKGQLSELQKKVHQQIKRNKGYVHTVRSLDDFIRVIADYTPTTSG